MSRWEGGNRSSERNKRLTFQLIASEWREGFSDREGIVKQGKCDPVILAK